MRCRNVRHEKYYGKQGLFIMGLNKESELFLQYFLFKFYLLKVSIDKNIIRFVAEAGHGRTAGLKRFK